MSTQTNTTTTETTKTFPIPHYHVGKNIPGYGPEGDVWTTDDWEDARTSLIGELEPESLTDDWDGPDKDRWESIAKEWDESVEEVKKLSPGEGYATVLPLSWSEYDLGISVWLQYCNEVCEDLDE